MDFQDLVGNISPTGSKIKLISSFWKEDNRRLSFVDSCAQCARAVLRDKLVKKMVGGLLANHRA